MKPKHSKFCVKASRPKLCFDTEKRALSFIQYNSEEISRQNGYAPFRAYYCTACGGWHLSSQPKESKEKKTRSYAQCLIEDCGWTHIIGYFKSSDMGKWKVDKNAVRVWDSSVDFEYWKAFGSLLRTEDQYLCEEGTWWIVRSPLGKLLINPSGSTVWALSLGARVGFEFSKPSRSIFYKDGNIKIL